MFRRIEVMDTFPVGRRKPILHTIKKGAYQTNGKVTDQDAYWDLLDSLKSPDMPHNKNYRFFFTELGWDTHGRRMVSLLKTTGDQFRIITIKESEREVMYKDKYQVALRPRKKR